MSENMVPGRKVPGTAEFIEKMALAENEIMSRAAERERRIIRLNQADRFARRAGKAEAYRLEQAEVDSSAFYKENNLKIDFQQMVHGLRTEYGMDEKQFASAAGMTMARLRRIERGEVLPKTAEIVRLAVAFDKSISLRLQ